MVNTRLASDLRAVQTPIRGTSLHDSVATRLRSMLFEGVLKTGDWIDEKSLAAQWQISRTPLREALKVLAAEGMVELVPNKGCRVTELDELDADALFPVMAMLEGRCAFEAAQRASDAQISELQGLHELLEQAARAKNIEAYFRHNHTFHRLVQAMAGNRWLNRVTDDLRQFLRMLRGRQLLVPGRLEASLNEHRVLMDALVQRDATRAANAMHDHLMAQLAALKKLRVQEAKAARRA